MRFVVVLLLLFSCCFCSSQSLRSSTTTHSAQLNWDSSSAPPTGHLNCSSTLHCYYKIYRCNGRCALRGGGWKLIYTTKPDVTSYTDSNCSAGNTYSWMVTGFTVIGNDVGLPSNITVATIPK